MFFGVEVIFLWYGFWGGWVFGSFESDLRKFGVVVGVGSVFVGFWN